MIHKLHVALDVLTNHTIELTFINLEINNKLENLEASIVLLALVTIFAALPIFAITKFGPVAPAKVGINDNVPSKSNLFV